MRRRNLAPLMTAEELAARAIALTELGEKCAEQMAIFDQLPAPSKRLIAEHGDAGLQAISVLHSFTDRRLPQLAVEIARGIEADLYGVVEDQG